MISKIWSPTLAKPRLESRVFRTAMAALLLSGNFLPVIAHADDATGPAAVSSALQPHQLRSKRFDIPFSVDAVGQRPSEVQLLVSRDAGQQWTKFASQPPTGKTFSFEAREDGEYWFATRTIDGAGNSFPEGPIQPLLFIRIDTTEPQIDLSLELSADNAVVAHLRCLDQWPSRESIKLEQMTDIDTTWSEVPGFASVIQAAASDHLEGTLRFQPAGDWHQLSVQATVKDLAGNQAIATHQLQRPRLAATPGQLASSPLHRAGSENGAATPTAQVNPYAVAAMQIINPPPMRMATPPAGAPPYLSSPFFAASALPPGADAPPILAGIAAEPLLSGTPAPLPQPEDPNQLSLTSPGQPQPAETPLPKRATSPAQAMRPISAEEISRTQPALPQSVARPSLGGSESLPRTIPQASLPPLDSSSTSAPIRHSSSRKFSLDYEVESAGRAGVQEVELWGSVDRGQTWKRWGTDPDRQTPFDIETNNDGVYGFSIVVVASNGLATPSPIAQSTPDIYVAVDTLKPVVRITGAAYGDGDQTGSLLIRYECQDESLSTRPISLAFSDSPQGPWTTIAAGLENRGGYVWPADPQLPRQIYLRIDAIDLAGNSGSYVLDTPIDIQGLAPRARIRGFNPISGSTPANHPAPQTATAPSATFK